MEFFEEEGDSAEEEKHGGFNEEHGHSKVSPIAIAAQVNFICHLTASDTRSCELHRLEKQE